MSGARGRHRPALSSSSSSSSVVRHLCPLFSIRARTPVRWLFVTWTHECREGAPPVQVPGRPAWRGTFAPRAHRPSGFLKSRTSPSVLSHGPCALGLRMDYETPRAVTHPAFPTAPLFAGPSPTATAVHMAGHTADHTETCARRRLLLPAVSLSVFCVRRIPPPTPTPAGTARGDPLGVTHGWVPLVSVSSLRSKTEVWFCLLAACGAQRANPSARAGHCPARSMSAPSVPVPYKYRSGEPGDFDDEL